MTTTNNTINKTNNRLIDRILEHGIEVDTLVTFEGRQVLKTSTGKVYIYNAEKGRASQYEADGTGYTPITVERFNAQVKAAEARIQRDVETSKRVRENTQRYEAASHVVKAVSDADTTPDAVPDPDEIEISMEELWVSRKKNSYLWEPGTIITIRAMTQTDEEKPTIVLDEDGYHITFEEVRSENGVAVPTGKTIIYTFAANDDAVKSFKNAINRRSDNWFWNKLNQGVEHRWECKPVTTIALKTFFAYLRKYPVKALYDYTEWVDANGEAHQSRNPKIRFWLPSDFTEKKPASQWHNVRATF